MSFSEYILTWETLTLSEGHWTTRPFVASVNAPGQDGEVPIFTVRASVFCIETTWWNWTWLTIFTNPVATSVTTEVPESACDGEGVSIREGDCQYAYWWTTRTRKAGGRMWGRDTWQAIGEIHTVGREIYPQKRIRYSAKILRRGCILHH